MGFVCFLVGRKMQCGQYFAKEEIRSFMGNDELIVFPDESDSGFGCPITLAQRSRVYAAAAFAVPIGLHEFSYLRQSAFDGIVIVLAVSVVGELRSVFGLEGLRIIVGSKRNDGFCARKEFGRIVAKRQMAAHVVHCSIFSRIEPFAVGGNLVFIDRSRFGKAARVETARNGEIADLLFT